MRRLVLASYRATANTSPLASISAHTSVSLIWVTSFFGSLIAGISGVYLTDRLGFGLVSPSGGQRERLSLSRALIL